eukprot:4770633-Pleurochrysis_carterae.AAC.2
MQAFALQQAAMLRASCVTMRASVRADACVRTRACGVRAVALRADGFASYPVHTSVAAVRLWCALAAALREDMLWAARTVVEKVKTVRTWPELVRSLREGLGFELSVGSAFSHCFECIPQRTRSFKVNSCDKLVGEPAAALTLALAKPSPCHGRSPEKERDFGSLSAEKRETFGHSRLKRERLLVTLG